MKRIVIGVVILIGITLFYVSAVSATITTGFIFEPLTPEKTEQISESMNFVLENEFQYTGKIKCFDIREDGSIIVGFSNSNQKTIGVFSNTGAFLRSYTFTLDGSFGLEWSEDVILVCCSRPQTIVAISDEAELIDAYSIPICSENAAYWNEIYKQERIISGLEYSIENNVGVVLSTSNITVKDINGVENNIISTSYTSEFLIALAMCGILLLCFACALCYVKIKQRDTTR